MQLNPRKFSWALAEDRTGKSGTSLEPCLLKTETSWAIYFILSVDLLPLHDLPGPAFSTK